jgi:PTH1 family peptidyl-tRNA hydrolase
LSTAIRLIVGLGNPGQQYEGTRHNAGAEFVLALARANACTLSPESKFFGLTGRLSVHGHDVKLLIPTTFMNRSGQAIAAMTNFYKIPVDAILVAHDELDLPPGVARLKQGGGHGGHNGLRDTISALGNQKNFHRLRIGIGHPGNAEQVVGYVLNRAPQQERQAIESSIDEAVRVLPEILEGNWPIAMNKLHSFQANS